MKFERERRARRRKWLDDRVGREWVSVKALAQEMKDEGLYAQSTYLGDIANSIMWNYLDGVIERRSKFSGVYGFEIRRTGRKGVAMRYATPIVALAAITLVMLSWPRLNLAPTAYADGLGVPSLEGVRFVDPQYSPSPRCSFIALAPAGEDGCIEDHGDCGMYRMSYPMWREVWLEWRHTYCWGPMRVRGVFPATDCWGAWEEVELLVCATESGAPMMHRDRCCTVLRLDDEAPAPKAWTDCDSGATCQHDPGEAGWEVDPKAALLMDFITSLPDDAAIALLEAIQ